jgi:hypothetical protein
MIDRTLVVTIGGAVVLAIIVLEMVRRRRLQEEYSLLWLGTAAVILLLAGSRGLLDLLAWAMGVHYPPTSLLVVGFGCLLAAALHFSAVVSRLSDENKGLAQELAILRWQVQQMERRLDAAGPRGRA